jgi:hypothetical protein
MTCVCKVGLTPNDSFTKTDVRFPRDHLTTEKKVSVFDKTSDKALTGTSAPGL